MVLKYILLIWITVSVVGAVIFSFKNHKNKHSLNDRLWTWMALPLSIIFITLFKIFAPETINLKREIASIFMDLYNF